MFLKRESCRAKAICKKCISQIQTNLLFLEMNGLLAEKRIDNKALVALALLIAASDPRHKDLMVKLIVNLLMEGEAPPAG